MEHKQALGFARAGFFTGMKLLVIPLLEESEASEIFRTLEKFDASGTVKSLETLKTSGTFGASEASGKFSDGASGDCVTICIRLLWLFSEYILAFEAVR